MKIKVGHSCYEKDIISNKLPILWYELLGEKGRELTEFRRFDEGKLYIHVHSAPWRHELTLRKQEFISNSTYLPNWQN
jgi:hypothetical protein